jgi:hypothetical protein
MCENRSALCNNQLAFASIVPDRIDLDSDPINGENLGRYDCHVSGQWEL